LQEKGEGRGSFQQDRILRTKMQYKALQGKENGSKTARKEKKNEQDEGERTGHNSARVSNRTISLQNMGRVKWKQKGTHTSSDRIAISLNKGCINAKRIPGHEEVKRNLSTPSGSGIRSRATGNWSRNGLGKRRSLALSTKSKEAMEEAAQWHMGERALLGLSPTNVT